MTAARTPAARTPAARNRAARAPADRDPAVRTPAERTLRHRAPPRRSTLVVTAALHLLVLWPYAASGLLAPGPAVLALLALWVALGFVAVRVHRRWGAVAALVPLLALGLWVGVLTLGEQVLGWTA